jgi:hypothetical protein
MLKETPAMTTPDDPRETAIDDLLNPGCEIERDELRQEAILAQTFGVMRRRRRLKRSGVALALAVCYLSGIATPVSWFTNRSDRSDGQIAMNQKEEPDSASRNKMETTPENENGDRPTFRGQRAEGTVAENGTVPFDSGMTDSPAVKISKYERMRREGDRLLREAGDIAQAVRRYNRALALASEAELAIAPDEDSWLLMALKTEHTKETKNDRSPIN